MLVAVVPVLLGGGAEQMRPSAVYAEVSSAIELRKGLALISDEELFASGGQLAPVRECGSDVVCVAKSLRAIDAGLGLIVVINFGVKPVLLDVRLVDAKNARLAGAIAEPVGAAEGTIGGAIKSRVGRLLDGAGFPSLAKIRVRSSPPSSEVVLSVGSEEQAGPEAAFVVAPGVQRVRARLGDTVVFERDVSIESGRELDVEAMLDPSAGGSITPWLIGAGAAAVVVGVTTVLLLTLGRGDCFCVVSPGVACDTCSP
jgi:hypothetical protein